MRMALRVLSRESLAAARELRAATARELREHTTGCTFIHISYAKNTAAFDGAALSAVT